MFIKIIEEIRAAESTALEIRKKADADASLIISEALKEADALCKAEEQSGEKEYKEKISQARRTAEARINENRRLSYENAGAMADIVKKRTDTAIAFVIDSILCGQNAVLQQ